MWAVTLVACGAAGFLIGWLLAAARVRTELEREIREAEVRAAKDQTEATVSLREAKLRLEEERKLLAEAERKLSDTFKSLASDALRSNSEAFLSLAGERLKPVKESLDKMDEQLGQIEQARNQAYGAIKEQVDSLIKTQAALRSETANLVKALRSPAVRGRWGEIQLKRVVELAGMVERCDFFEQESHDTDAGRLRPDLRVQLPGGKNIVVDAKVPLMAYLEALEAPTEELRMAKLGEHARQVRDHMGKLSSKAYWEHLQPTPEFVFMFLPGESFFSAALEQDPSLIEQGANQGVVLATPTTLIALLKAVAYGWRQEQLAENAERISTLGKQVHERLATMVGHLVRLGGSIRNCVDAFNDTVGSLESRLLPSARRFKELGVGGQQEIRELEPVVTVPRQVSEAIDEPAAAAPQDEPR
ncbi:MAG: DNA recombination protein RmuC [Candidatus Binataceae bacterium]